MINYVSSNKIDTDPYTEHCTTENRGPLQLSG
ncbi:hypothetical protein EL79_5282 [Escherichia coli]|nr:hypothetical protein EL79_5282 [Escherichia coli]